MYKLTYKTILLSLITLLGACEGNAAPTATATTVPSTPTTIPTSTATAMIIPSTPTTNPTSTRIPTATPVPGTAVTFLTKDDIQLAGTLYGDGDIAVIMAHQGTYGATQATWQPLIPALIENGFTGLPFDFRGFGQSSGLRRFAQLDDDIRAAAQYLRSLQYERIVCAGSCMGGTACLRAAIDGEPFIGLIILASPFNAGGGMVVYQEELDQLIQPKLFITGRWDGFGIARDINRMYEVSPEPKTLLTLETRAHGTDLFQTNARAELTDAIVNFLISLR